MHCFFLKDEIKNHVAVINLDRNNTLLYVERRGSVVVSMSACHAAGRGSIP